MRPRSAARPGRFDRLVPPRRNAPRLPAGQTIIAESSTEKQTTLLVRAESAIVDPSWTVSPVSLDDLVLAYLRRSRDGVAALAAGLVAAP